MNLYTDPSKAPPCLHCQADARLTDGREIYPHRPDLHEKKFWKCDPCNATVGCHPNSTRALGFPANKETKQARMKLHNERLDPFWKSQPKPLRKAARNACYKHLSDAMGIKPENTHTGMFTVEQCREAWKALGSFTFEAAP